MLLEALVTGSAGKNLPEFTLAMRLRAIRAAAAAVILLERRGMDGAVSSIGVEPPVSSRCVNERIVQEGFPFVRIVCTPRRTQRPIHHINQPPFQATHRRPCRFPLCPLLRVIRLRQCLTPQLAQGDDVEHLVQLPIAAPVEAMPVPPSRRDRNGRDSCKRGEGCGRVDARRASQFAQQPCRDERTHPAHLHERCCTLLHPLSQGGFDALDLFSQPDDVLGKLAHDQQTRLEHTVGVRHDEVATIANTGSGSEDTTLFLSSKDRPAASARATD